MVRDDEERTVYQACGHGNIKKQETLLPLYSDLYLYGHDVLYRLLLCRSEEFRKVPGAETLQSVLGFGVIVIGLFSLIFLYYTNSFLIRRRQKEFGLYNILGMGKRNLVKILLWENILTAAVSLVSGLACGVLLSKAVELTAARILGGMADFGFAADPDALADTAVLFAGIFFLVMLRMLVVILRSRPVEDAQKRERGREASESQLDPGSAGTGSSGVRIPDRGYH